MLRFSINIFDSQSLGPLWFRFAIEISRLRHDIEYPRMAYTQGEFSIFR